MVFPVSVSEVAHRAKIFFNGLFGDVVFKGYNPFQVFRLHISGIVEVSSIDWSLRLKTLRLPRLHIPVKKLSVWVTLKLQKAMITRAREIHELMLPGMVILIELRHLWATQRLVHDVNWSRIEILRRVLVCSAHLWTGTIMSYMRIIAN